MPETDCNWRLELRNSESDAGFQGLGFRLWASWLGGCGLSELRHNDFFVLTTLDFDALV